MFTEETKAANMEDVFDVRRVGRKKKRYQSQRIRIGTSHSCFTFYRGMARAYLTKLMTCCENAGNPVIIQGLKQHDEPLQVYV